MDLDVRVFGRMINIGIKRKIFIFLPSDNVPDRDLVEKETDLDVVDLFGSKA